MKTFSTPITNEAAADHSSWVELYDIYLKAAITTPWGSVNVLRLCSRLGNEFSFFTPAVAPEDAGTREDAATYYPWPLKRAVVKSSGQFTDNKLEITGSNVDQTFLEEIAGIDWYDVPVVIRKTSPGLVGATAADCAILFSGLVDSIRVNEQSLTLVCSNDLALLNRILPSENMHASCRFRWAEDMCTAMRFKAENYKAKTAGSSSTTTLVKSADFTEDTGNSAGYGTDLVDALADAAITASSERTTRQVLFRVKGNRFYLISGSENFQVDDEVRFIGSAPTGFATATDYYVVAVSGLFMALSATLGGLEIVPSGTGLWLIEAQYGNEAHKVKDSHPAQYWAFDTDADWGTVEQAYYVIPDAQAGLKNAALKPYIQFDFGSAKTPKLWRVSSVPNTQPEQRIRMVQFFSSPDASTWTFESYFQLPNRGGELFDVLIPKAASARYWRICVRSRWAESLYKPMFSKVYAYELSRNWWLDGKITFGAATATVALRNVSRAVRASYSGEVAVAELPVAPASGDTFVIERGCGRTFNACAARLNTENYGGFDDLPTQTVIR
jgi:hypothetical protein